MHLFCHPEQKFYVFRGDSCLKLEKGAVINPPQVSFQGSDALCEALWVHVCALMCIQSPALLEEDPQDSFSQKAEFSRMSSKEGVGVVKH